jgi:diaminopimelate decarboxylase
MPERGQAGAVADPIAGSPVYPAGSRVNERGHLEVGGCDVVELAAELGTPAYVYAEEEMRARARAYREAFERRCDDFEILFASKAFPCTAAYRLFAEEGLAVDVASGGELHMALRAGFDPQRIHMHGNNKSDEEILLATRAGVGHLILDSFDEIERCERLLDRQQDVLIRVTPGIKPSTHDYVQTGQLDSKFGFGLEDGLAARAIERVLSSDVLNLVGLHAHIGSQIFELEPYRWRSRRFGELAGEWCRLVNVGGGLGIAYTAEDEPPRSTAYVDVKVRGVAEVFGEGVRIWSSPGRSLVGNAGRHRIPGRHRQGDPRRPHLRRGRRRHVRQHAPDALRLRGMRRLSPTGRRGARYGGDDRGHALRVRRRTGARRDARHAGGGRLLVTRRRALRSRDGEQLQRRSRGRR